MTGFIIWLVISAILLVAGIIFSILTIVEGAHDYWGIDEVKMAIASILTFFSSFSLVLAICCTSKVYEQYEKFICNILSIRNESGVQGSFCLGTGYVKDTQYYLYYYQADKGIKMDKVEADKTYIIETNSRVPCIYEIKNRGDYYSFYELYVPENTLILSYTLQ